MSPQDGARVYVDYLACSVCCLLLLYLFLFIAQMSVLFSFMIASHFLTTVIFKHLYRCTTLIAGQPVVILTCQTDRYACVVEPLQLLAGSVSDDGGNEEIWRCRGSQAYPVPFRWCHILWGHRRGVDRSNLCHWIGCIFSWRGPASKLGVDQCQIIDEQNLYF